MGERFAWEHVRVLGNGEALGGPGLLETARPGDRVALLESDGATIETTIETVNRDTCQDGDPVDECTRAWIAETGDMQLPELVPHALEVRVFDGLCEADEDDGDFVLVERTSSAGPNPVAGAPALTAHRGDPTRIVTVRAAPRSFHFVATTDLDLPKTRRMADLAGQRQETFFILEGDPWSVVRVNDETLVLTRTGLRTYDRWSSTGTGIHRAGTWTADVLELF